MSDKLRVNHTITITVAAVGAAEFGKAFLEKAGAVVRGLAGQFKAKDITLTLDSKVILATFFGVDLKLADELRKTMVQKLVLLAEHGPDSDLLDNLLERYPELKNHPNLSHVVAAFENLHGVIKHTLGDRSPRTVAGIQANAGAELDPQDLKATHSTDKDMTPAERAAFRDLAILGQTPEQKKAAEAEQLAVPVVPDIYKKLAAKDAKGPAVVGATPKEFGPPLPGDEGNVFTRPSKK